jgi:hypothetical protein
MLSAFVNCAKTVLPALAMAQWCSQKLQFLNFPIAKGETKTIAHLVNWNWLPNWQLKTRRRSSNLKGSQRSWDGQNLL